jgi:plasmid maintenance system antidote protein VapI/predicted transcriptional regulator
MEKINLTKIKNPFNEYLQKDFLKKKSLNPRYSLRAYAKSLSISPSHLSLLLSDQRVVKYKSALKIGENLGLTPSQLFSYLKIDSKTVRSKEKKILSSTEFSLISEWYYYAILGISNLTSNSTNINWIAKKLNLPYSTVSKAYRELLKYGHIIEKWGQFKQATPNHRTTDDVPSLKIKHYHKQNLKLAADKLDQTPPELREFCTMTIPIHPKNISAAKQMIRRFKEEFSEELDRGKQTEVYNLCIQFFPLTHIENFQNTID